MNKEAKKSLPSIVIFVLVIALVVCFAKIRSLESEVDILRGDLSSEISMLRNDVNSIYNNVDEMLKAEASLLASSFAEYGEVDLENHTVDLTVKLVPKLISDDMKVQVSINGRRTDLTKDGNEFIGVIPVDLFNDEEQLLLTIQTEAGIQTQYIPEIQTQYLWGGRIPTLYFCDISGNGRFTQGKYTLDAAIDINCSPVEETPGIRFEKFVLVTELNGTEINREDISEDVLNYQNYPHGVYFRDEYHMECDAEEGDELIIRLEATDSMGYVHKMILHLWKEQNGAVAEAINGSEFIYDASGNLIFGKE